MPQYLRHILLTSNKVNTELVKMINPFLAGNYMCMLAHFS